MRKLISLSLFITCLAFVISGCGLIPSPTPTPEAAAPTSVPPTLTPTPAPSTPPEEEDLVTAFELTSTAFAPGEMIPSKYTCDGEDISPPLRWSDPPQDTQNFALIADDLDAPMGTWVHWVLYNLPSEKRILPEAVPPDAELPDGGRNGQNSWGRLGYGGPCPPSGTHRYFFKLYALDTVLDLAASADKEQLLQAMEGHILAEAELMETYTRK